jgi:hypothetical protein
MLDVSGDGSSEEGRFLRDEADLVAEPADVELLQFDAVELDGTFDGVAER